MLACHVDDAIVSCNNDKLLTRFQERLLECYSLSLDSGSNTYLSVQFNRTESGAIELSQYPYTRAILEEYGFTSSKGVSTPSAHGYHPTSEQSPKTDKEKAEMTKWPYDKYKALLGSLLYLATMTRPDIRYSAGVAARFAQNPGKAHWTLLVRILKYLSRYPNKCIRYGDGVEGIPHCPLVGFCDATWGCDPSTRRSVSGHIVYSWSGPIEWGSKLQRCTALSSAESELISSNRAGKSLVWLRRIYHHDFGYKLKELSLADKNGLTKAWFRGASPTVLFCDNTSTIHLSKNKCLPQASRHIQIRYSWIREQVRDGLIALAYVSTSENVSDVMTKGPTPATFARLCSRMVHSPTKKAEAKGS